MAEACRELEKIDFWEYAIEALMENSYVDTVFMKIEVDGSTVLWTELAADRPQVVR